MEENLNIGKEKNIIVEQSSSTEHIETEIANQIVRFFKEGETALLREIKKFNRVKNLVLQGEYRKSRDNNYGFFVNVNHVTEKEIYYPILNSTINSIFVPPNNLKEGGIYTFEVKMAHIKERNKQQNPFLLQTKIESIEESIHLSEIQSMILEAKNVLSEKKNEADKIIERCNVIINSKHKEIGEKENIINNINNQISEIKIQLSEYLNKKYEMESTISLLRQKIDVCKNLEFISEQDANKYLDILETTPFDIGDKYLDFEKDLSGSFSKLATHIQHYLFFKKNLIYTEFQIKNFLTLLMTNDLIILSGLSGSGKTQIVKSFAEVLGGVAKIIPVKPNWTSSDDLLGYYNPIQSSFLPTPFTEAIAEAIQNPNQIYLICLDEMNLARAEYYFADFLSKMEDRSQQPEIDLYAKHEEELFVSEFNILLALIESAIGKKKISSWQDFLETDTTRNRFFELLGNTEKETILQIHSKMRRRLLDVLKFPSTIKIPNNVRFIGAINVDETTHYFSPKILDRVHIIKFENPLLYEEKINKLFERKNIDKDLKPVYINPDTFAIRKEYPILSDPQFSNILPKLKEINERYLLPLNIDFGVRSIRQSLNYASKLHSVFEYYFYSLEYGRTDMPEVRSYYTEENNLGRINTDDIALNAIIIQKIFPRFIFDGNEIAKNGTSKIQVVKDLQNFLSIEFNELYHTYESNEMHLGKLSSEYLEEMIEQANRNNSQFNFFA